MRNCSLPVVGMTLILASMAGCYDQGGGAAPMRPVGGPVSAKDSDAKSQPDLQTASHRKLPQDLSLEESQREYLWDLEHHSNVLGQYGLKRIGGQFKARDAAGLRKHLAADFRGQILDSTNPVDFNSPTLSAARATETSHELREATADEFLAWLDTLAAGFREIAGTQFGVKRIGPLEAEQVDGLWWVWCTFRAWGQDAEGKPREVGCILSLELRRPTEENLAEPGWLVSAKVLQTSNSQASQFLFREVTSDLGIDVAALHDNWTTESKLQVTGGMYATDFNRDGYVDLLVTDEGKQLETLYQGQASGKFQNVTVEMGLDDPTSLPRTSISAAFVDLDGDGWDDLISGDGVVRRNMEGRGFEDVTGRSNFALVAQIALPRFGPSICGIIPADFDRDGLIDLYLTRIGPKPASWLADTNEVYLPHQLLRNVGNWRFEDMTRKFGVDGGGRICCAASWLDADNDGWPDLYIINEFGDGRLYVNQKGQGFESMDVDKEVDDFGSMGLAVGDIDNDNAIDLYVASMYSKAGSRIIGNLSDATYEPDVMRRLRSLVDGSELYRNQGGLKFRGSGHDDQVHDAGWAWGPLLADFDNDGFLDLYATAGYMSRDRSKPDG